MSDTNDKRLSVRPYRLTIERVQRQFDLIRFSLQTLKSKEQKQFFKEISAEKIAKIEQFRAFAKQHKLFPDAEVDQIADMQVKAVESELRRQNRAGNLRL